MKIEQYVCNSCGKRVDYTDSDGDSYQAGITMHGGADVKMHVPTSSGSSHPGTRTIDFTNLCSPECFDAEMTKISRHFHDAWDKRDVNVVDGARVNRDKQQGGRK